MDTTQSEVESIQSSLQSMISVLKTVMDAQTTRVEVEGYNYTESDQIAFPSFIEQSRCHFETPEGTE